MTGTIILDLDGPVLDGRRRHYRCYATVLSQLGLAPLPLERYWRLKRSGKTTAQLLASSGANERRAEFLKRWRLGIETRPHLALDAVQSGARGALEGWRQEGRRILLTTLRVRKAALHWQLRRLGLQSLFDQVLVGAGLGAAEKVELVRPVLTGIRRRSVIWIGDTEADIHAARDLRLRCCIVTCGLRSRDFLARLAPDALVSGLGQATKVVSVWDDLGPGRGTLSSQEPGRR